MKPIWIALFVKALSWLIKNGDIKLYSANTPAGKRIGGSDVPELPDKYFILDARVAAKIIFLGYFQTA